MFALLYYLVQAYRGKYLWQKLRRKYGGGRFPVQYVFFPEKDDEEYTSYGIQLLPEYISRNKFDKVIVIVMSRALLSVCERLECKEVVPVLISMSEMRCFIRFLGLVMDLKEWTIVSVKKPYDTHSENLVGKKGITKRDIVWYDIYKMC